MKKHLSVFLVLLTLLAFVAVAESAALAGRGDKGELVADIQQKLITLGYLSGSADGVFGKGTEKAVSAFQTANGLTSDGIVSRETYDRLTLLAELLPEVYTADALLAASASELTGLPVKVTGEISAIQSLNDTYSAMGFEGSTVRVLLRADAEGQRHIACYIAEADTKLAKALKRGQTVTFRGTYASGSDDGVSLGACTVAQ